MIYHGNIVHLSLQQFCQSLRTQLHHLLQLHTSLREKKHFLSFKDCLHHSIHQIVDIIVTTRSAPLPTTSLEPAAVLASSKSEKLTLDIFPDLEVNKDVHVTRLILIPHLLNKIELQEFVVDDLEKSFDNNEVSYENLGETIAVIELGEPFNNPPM